jgi:hypothetical protein
MGAIFLAAASRSSPCSAGPTHRKGFAVGLANGLDQIELAFVTYRDIVMVLDAESHAELGGAFAHS